MTCYNEPKSPGAALTARGMADPLLGGIDIAERICSVPGCDNSTRSSKADWCKKHYHRWYRHGSVDVSATESGLSVYLGRRYRYKVQPDHPLADVRGRVYVHRAVLYDKIGPGPHPCHWCTRPVDWLPKGHPDCLQTDHLNNLGDDNRPENLAPSCSGCNSQRGAERRGVLLRQMGWWSKNDTVAKLKSGRKHG